MGNSSSSLQCRCPCTEQSTKFLDTNFEDTNLRELDQCRFRLQQEEYFKQYGIRCGLNCSNFESSDTWKPVVSCESCVIKPRNVSSDEELDKNAIKLCCNLREAAECEDEFCTGNPYPSHKKEYLEIINKKSPKNRKEPVPKTKIVPATEQQRREYWIKYFSPVTLTSLQTESPEQILQTTLQNPCSCHPVKQQLPTCEQMSELLELPNINCQGYPTYGSYSSIKCPNIQIPRTSFDPTLSRGINFCSQQMTNQTPNLQIKSLHIQPFHHQSTSMFPNNDNKYRGSFSQGGEHYYPQMWPTQQAIQKVGTPSQSHSCPQNYFLEALHVGQVAPTNLSVSIYSNNVITAEVSGFHPQAQSTVRNTISKRWTIPPEVLTDNIVCFLGNEKLVIVTQPPPEKFYQILNLSTAQCLGPPRRFGYPYPHV